MRWFASFIFFFLSVILFLAGVFPFSFLGISFPIAGFIFWALHAGSYRYLFGGIAGGIIIDSVSPLPFGTHLATFFLLAVFIYFFKKFLHRRHMWGEFFSMFFGLVLGNLTLALALYFSQATQPRPIALLLMSLFTIGGALTLSLLLFWYEYRDYEIRGSTYVV